MSRLILAVDRLLASPEVHLRAQTRAQYAVAQHGDRAVHSLRRKLADPRRRQTLRELRLALAALSRQANA